MNINLRIGFARDVEVLCNELSHQLFRTVDRCREAVIIVLADVEEIVRIIHSPTKESEIHANLLNRL